MKRRTKTDRTVLPTRLATFQPDQWPGVEDHEKYGAWMGARSEWADEHGIVALPGHEDAWLAYPDAPFRLDEL